MPSDQVPTVAELAQADAAASVSLEAPPALVTRLSTLFSGGCFVRVETGCTYRELLTQQFQIDPAYVEKDIKVLFLDSSPVDDVDAAIIKNGSTIALSGAMPGVVGAAMRKDGLGMMRSGITYREKAVERVRGPGAVFLKLFNVVMADLGPAFLRRGVYAEPSQLARLFERLDLHGPLDALPSAARWVRLSIR